MSATPISVSNARFVRDLIMVSLPYRGHQLPPMVLHNTANTSAHISSQATSTTITSTVKMQQHYRQVQRQYLEWRTQQQETKKEQCSYIRPHLRQLRSDWFTNRLTEAKVAAERKQKEEARFLLSGLIQAPSSSGPCKYYKPSATYSTFDFAAPQDRGRSRKRDQSQSPRLVIVRGKYVPTLSPKLTFKSNNLYKRV